MLVSNLPGADVLLPETELSIGAVVGAVVTVALVAVLAFVGRHLEVPLVQASPGPTEVVADVAAAAKYLVWFVAVDVGYHGLAALVRPLIDAVGLWWTYNLLFFVLTLVATAMIVVRLYGNFDHVAELVTAWLTAPDDEDAAEQASVSPSWPASRRTRRGNGWGPSPLVDSVDEVQSESRTILIQRENPAVSRRARMSPVG